MTEIFQGVKPCTTCRHYKQVNRKHTCIKHKQRTETARLIAVSCHIEKKVK